MLTAARTSGDTVPALLMANYKLSDDNPDQLDIQRAMSAYGVKDYMLLERGGITYGIFGLMGTDSDDCAPTPGFTLEDPIEAAKRCVKALEEQGIGRPSTYCSHHHHDPVETVHHQRK